MTGEAYLQGSKVDNAVNVCVLGEDVAKLLLIRDVALVVLWSLARDQLDTVDDFCRRVVEIVDDDHLVVSLEEREYGE